jgi:hypothetical protein
VFRFTQVPGLPHTQVPELVDKEKKTSRQLRDDRDLCFDSEACVFQVFPPLKRAQWIHEMVVGVEVSVDSSGAPWLTRLSE